MTWTNFESVLVAEGAKKSAVAWVSAGGAACPVWTAWDDGALYFATGGAEPPVHGVESADEVTVWLRSSDSRGLLMSFRGRVQVLDPNGEAWHRAADLLSRKALNTTDRDARVATWRDAATLVRVEPFKALTPAPIP